MAYQGGLIGGIQPIPSVEQPGVAGTTSVGNYNQLVTDASAFSLTLDSGQRNAIQWIAAKDKILVGTSGGEWRISGQSDKALTPTCYDVKQQTIWGSKDMGPLVLHKAVLFVDVMAKKIRAMQPSGDSVYERRYVSPDLNVLAEHITEDSTITSMAYQKNPDSIIWATMADGSLISCTYDTDQNVVAWAEHPFSNGTAESVCVIPGSTEDEVWMSVARTINSSTVRYIERMKVRYYGTDQDDCFFVDSGYTYDSTATTTITGLGHLEAASVVVMGDGVEQANKTVSSGSITITSASTVHVGLAYTYKLKPMRMDQNMQTGTTKGSIKRIAEAVVSVYKSFGTQYDNNETTYDLIVANNTEDPANFTANTLYTGDLVAHVDGGFSVENPFELTASDPYPCIVRAIIPRVELTGR
jgi:hypothetical protein